MKKIITIDGEKYVSIKELKHFFINTIIHSIDEPFDTYLINQMNDFLSEKAKTPDYVNPKTIKCDRCQFKNDCFLYEKGQELLECTRFSNRIHF